MEKETETTSADAIPECNWSRPSLGGQRAGYAEIWLLKANIDFEYLRQDLESDNYATAAASMHRLKYDIREALAAINGGAYTIPNSF